jgi:CHAT domain-containing protein
VDARCSAKIYRDRLSLILGEQTALPEEPPTRHNLLWAEWQHNLAEWAFYRGDYTKNIAHAEASIREKENIIKQGQTGGQYQMALGHSLVIAGKGHWQKGDPYEALIHYFKGLNHYREAFGGIKHYLPGNVFCLIGQVYLNLREIEKAELFLDKSRRLLEQSLGHKEHIYLGATYTQLGKCCVQKMTTKTSTAEAVQIEQYFRKARQILSNTMPNKQHRYLASMNKNWGFFYKRLEDLGIDLKVEKNSSPGKLYDRELKIRLDVFGRPWHATIADVKIRLGRLCLEEEKWEAAMEQADEALHACLVSEKLAQDWRYHQKLSAEDISAKMTFLDAARLWVEAQRRQAGESGVGQTFTMTLDLLRRAVEVIEYSRRDYISEASRFFLSQRARPIFEEYFQLLFDLPSSMKTREWEEEVFRILQCSKATTLLDYIQKTHLEPGQSAHPGEPALIPVNPTLQALERKVEQDKLDQLSSADFDELKKLFRQRKYRLGQIIRTEEQQLSRPGEGESSYFIQLDAFLNALHPKEPAAVISYFVGESSVFAVTLRQFPCGDRLKLSTLCSSQQLAKIRKNVQQTIEWLNKSVLNKESGREAEELEAYRKSGKDKCLINRFLGLRNLHIWLVKPLDLSGIKRLYVIPDGFLSFLPFEILIDSGNIPPTENPDYFYARPNYLIRKYQIAYSSSAALLFNAGTKKNSRFRVRNLHSLCTEVVVENDPDPQANSSLRGVVKEVARICEDFGLKSASHSPNPKGGSIEKIKAYRNILNALSDQEAIIHFFGHSSPWDTDDANNPEFVILLEDWRANADRFSRDLSKCRVLSQYNLSRARINSSLVLLNICSGGEGQEMAGEAPMTLNRAVIRAGATNLYSTLFSIHSSQARKMAANFLKNLLENEMTFAQALQAIKLKEIEKARSHPAYWAAPIFIGNQMGTLQADRFRK